MVEEYPPLDSGFHPTKTPRTKASFFDTNAADDLVPAANGLPGLDSQGLQARMKGVRRETCMMYDIYDQMMYDVLLLCILFFR